MSRNPLFSTLNELLQQELVDSTYSNLPRISLQSLKTALLLRTAHWAGVGWSDGLHALTGPQHALVHPSVAEKLSLLVPDPSASLQQIVVPVDKALRSLSSPKKEVGSEVDALLAVDGLAAPPYPDFETKRYLDHCRFSRHGRDPAFELGTLEDDDKRVHVEAVRRMYSSGATCRSVYLALREAYRDMTTVLDPVECSDEELAEVPELAKLYVPFVGEDRMKRLAEKFSERREKRGRKRKMVPVAEDA